MAAIGLIGFPLLILGQGLLAGLAFKLARERGDAARALALVVFVGGFLAVFVFGIILVVIAELLLLALYAFISRPSSNQRTIPSR